MNWTVFWNTSNNPLKVTTSLQVKIHTRIADIPAHQWNDLIQDNNPFVRHEFLHALEKHQCVGEKFGWLPRHLAIYEKDQLIGAMPLYEKYNSYGEFVFDHAWADAWSRAGLQYFPKLVSAIPYTPAQGQRLLARQATFEKVAPLLLQAAQQLAENENMSGCHILFPGTTEQQWLAQQGMLTRHDCQFHWHNHGYQNFADFLATLTAKKRKNIRQERKRVSDSKIQIRILDGHTATETDWENFTRFYNNTFNQKWGTATLNQAFFMDVAQQLPKQVVLVLADKNQTCIAGSLMYRSDTTLYGRFWGSDQPIDKLHFEACYYQGIEYCIQHQLQTFEPGAQGEHKIARGFLPTLTQSSHWLTDNPFQESIRRYTEHEQQAIAEYIKDCNQHSPYRK